jgi:beta-N-acetylhexosaminidase
MQKSTLSRTLYGITVTLLCALSACQTARLERAAPAEGARPAHGTAAAAARTGGEKQGAGRDLQPEGTSAQKTGPKPSASCTNPSDHSIVTGSSQGGDSSVNGTGSDDGIGDLVGGMSIEQKIGQRFISKIEGTALTEQTKTLILEQNIGGIILYPWNVSDFRQVRELIDAVQALSREGSPPIGLFICADQEGGRVNAFKLREISLLPAPFFWGRNRDPEYVSSAAYILCSEMRALGCNMNFAPVLDLYGTPDSTIIGDRSMGEDPELVARLGAAYIAGSKKAGIIPVAKHFPGHGGSTVDSHRDLPLIWLSKEELSERDLVPFKAAIDSGLEAVMTAHVLFPLIDPDYPVTLSSRMLRTILRGELGFEGVVVSDGMSMGALSNHYQTTETLRLMFRAGVDLILVHHRYDPGELIQQVLELYRMGEITDREIDEGVERILRLKRTYGLLTPGTPDR